jgi:hypothetical protein
VAVSVAVPPVITVSTSSFNSMLLTRVGVEPAANWFTVTIFEATLPSMLLTVICPCLALPSFTATVTSKDVPAVPAYCDKVIHWSAVVAVQPVPETVTVREAVSTSPKDSEDGETVITLPEPPPLLHAVNPIAKMPAKVIIRTLKRFFIKLMI